MSAGLAASTVTPGSTPPDSSLTMPTMEACAQASAGTSTTLRNTSRDDMLRRSVRCIALTPFGSSVYPVSRAHHPADLDRVGDVDRRVGVEQHQVRGLSRSNGPVVRILRPREHARRI